MQIGGVRAPSPVGELGNVEMTQALTLVDTAWRAVGPDMLLTGALALHLAQSWVPIGAGSKTPCPRLPSHTFDAPSGSLLGREPLPLDAPH